ncbi:hypothetical protein JW905_14105 [bacterium]|nr:hypothetical protein [candidate division CSSED10-310 bacterium]
MYISTQETHVKFISTAAAPAAVGPYSQAVQAGDWLFCSGQIGIDPTSGTLAEGMLNQTVQVLANLKAVLRAAGLDVSQVVKTTIYLTDMADFPEVNRLYGDVFGSHRPARATVAVAALPLAALVEMDCVACRT